MPGATDLRDRSSISSCSSYKSQQDKFTKIDRTYLSGTSSPSYLESQRTGGKTTKTRREKFKRLRSGRGQIRENIQIFLSTSYYKRVYFGSTRVPAAASSTLFLLPARTNVWYANKEAVKCSAAEKLCRR